MLEGLLRDHLMLLVYPLPWPLLVGESNVPTCGPTDSFSVHLTSSAVHSGGVCPQIPGCVCGCSWRDDVCECYRGGIVVINVTWLCVNMTWGRVIYLFWVGQGCDEWPSNYCTNNGAAWQMGGWLETHWSDWPTPSPREFSSTVNPPAGAMSSVVILGPNPIYNFYQRYAW